MLKTLVLVRHGESIQNIGEHKRRCSHCFHDEEDRRQVNVNSNQLISLSEKGMEQAKKVGEALRSNFGQFDLIANSGFIRTRQTTEGILSAYPLDYRSAAPIWETALIREREPGIIYFWTEAEVEKNFPWFFDYWDSADNLFRLGPGGESLIGMATTRLPLFLRELEDRTAGSYGAKVLVVAHSRAIQGLRFLLEGWSYERFRDEISSHCPPNGSVTIYNWEQLQNRWQLDFANKVFD